MANYLWIRRLPDSSLLRPEQETIIGATTATTTAATVAAAVAQC